MFSVRSSPHRSRSFQVFRLQMRLVSRLAVKPTSRRCRPHQQTGRILPPGSSPRSTPVLCRLASFKQARPVRPNPVRRLCLLICQQATRPQSSPVQRSLVLPLVGLDPFVGSQVFRVQVRLVSRQTRASLSSQLPIVVVLIIRLDESF